MRKEAGGLKDDAAPEVFRSSFKDQKGRENEPEGCRTETGSQRMGKRKEAWAGRIMQLRQTPRSPGGWGDLKETLQVWGEEVGGRKEEGC